MNRPCFFGFLAYELYSLFFMSMSYYHEYLYKMYLSGKLLTKRRQERFGKVIFSGSSRTQKLQSRISRRSYARWQGNRILRSAGEGAGVTKYLRRLVMAQNSKLLITIVGALSKQGRSTAHTLLQSGRYRVRALTRRVDAPEAQRLARQGAELMAVPLEVGHKKDLVNAFRGSHG